MKPGEGIDGSVAITREAAFCVRPVVTSPTPPSPWWPATPWPACCRYRPAPHANLGRAAEETLLEITAAAAEDIVQAERESRVTARANKVAAINETGIRMISVTDPAEVIRLGTSGAAMVLEADHAILRLQDPETGRFVIRSYFGARDGASRSACSGSTSASRWTPSRRRAPVAVRELEDDATLQAFDTGVEVANRRAPEARRPGDRHPGDLRQGRQRPLLRRELQRRGPAALRQVHLYLERALANAQFHARSRLYRNFDEETGLPNESYLKKRIHEEIARSAGREGSLALAICTIENLEEITTATDGIRSKRVVQRTVEALRAHLRDFDVLGRTGPSEFTILMPDPGFAPGDRDDGTHGQNVRAFEAWTEVIGLRAGDRYLVVNPFFHAFGYKAGWMSAIMRGATILPHAVFDASQVLERIGRDRVSMLPGPPALYQMILADPTRSEHDLASLRLAVTGAAAIPVELIHRMRDELGFETVITGYGLTEACGIATMCRYDDDPETIATTSGRAIPDVEVRCVDGEGAEVPRGEPGEIVVRGYNVMQGYFEDADGTAAAIDGDGWLHTGDVGVMDERGYVRITDRIKDMFIMGGFNCYPAEIENMHVRTSGRRGPGGGHRRAGRAHGRGRHGVRGARRPMRRARRPSRAHRAGAGRPDGELQGAAARARSWTSCR